MTRALDISSFSSFPFLSYTLVAQIPDLWQMLPYAYTYRLLHLITQHKKELHTKQNKKELICYLWNPYGINEQTLFQECWETFAHRFLATTLGYCCLNNMIEGDRQPNFFSWFFCFFQTRLKNLWRTEVTTAFDLWTAYREISPGWIKIISLFKQTSKWTKPPVSHSGIHSISKWRCDSDQFHPMLFSVLEFNSH